jgi:hypothetical protein
LADPPPRRIVDGEAETATECEIMTRRRLPLLQLLGAALLLSLAARGSGAEEARLAIGGYDPVAYFTDATPVLGRNDVDYLWHGARWHFESVAHRDLFARDPAHYAPQYDSYCAMGAARGPEAHKDTVDPHAWAIVDGKLYLTHSLQALAKWQKNAAENIKQADHDWPHVKKQSVVYDGYPNIKASPQ